VLNQLDELALAYYEIRNDLDLFLKLFHAMKKNKSLNQKDIQAVLRYAAFDIPALENRCQQLSSDVLELQFRKKKLGDEVATQCSSITQLEKSLNWYKMEIKQKKEIISNLDQQLNQKSNALEKLLLANK
jgi:argininosuccinate lyase